MKKLWYVLLAAAMFLTACAGGTPEDTRGSAPPEPSAAAEPAPVSQPLSVQEPEPDPEPEPLWTVSEGITVSLLQDVYPAGMEHLTLILDNGGDLELGYGEGFVCEKYVDGTWQHVDFLDRICFDDVLYLVQPHTAVTMTLDMGLLSRPLEQGLYRITGSNLWIGENEKAPAWQVSFRVTADARPEPDYALYISARPIPTVNGCAVTARLPVFFVNTTGKDGQVVDIPHLEKLDETGEWVEIPYKDRIGFCGTASRLPAEGRPWSEDISYLWGTLEDGRYRLSYNTSSDGSTGQPISGTFTLYTPEDNYGLPLFTGVIRD